MSNPIQTGDGVGMAVEGIKSIAGMFKGDKKNKRKESFSEGVSHDKILRTARAMAQDKQKHKQTMLDKKLAALPSPKANTKFEASFGKTKLSGTTAFSTPPKAAPKKPAAGKKPLTTKQAAVSVPTPKKAAAKPKAKAATAKTPPPTSARARKVK